MGNTKFKIGDKVRVINANCGAKSMYIDNVYTIGHINPYYTLQPLEHYLFKENTDGWAFRVEELELFEKRSFTKADLKPGMVVEYKDGERRLVVGDAFIGRNSYALIADFTDDLKHNGGFMLMDIVKVYKSSHKGFDKIFKDLYLTLVWERKDEAKEMTVSEIEKKLGYKVKVIADKE